MFDGRFDDMTQERDADRIPDRHVVVVADGDVDAARLASLTRADPLAGRVKPLLIAADGGASKTLAAGVTPDIVIGDGDSLPADERARLETLGVEIRDADRDKDESDAELCLLAAVEAGAQRISILGALGGRRPEHTVANLLVLGDPRLDGIEVEILDRASRLTRIGSRESAGAARIEGASGDYVSLFPLSGEVHGVRTSGLRFALKGESLTVGPTRGLSNEMLDVQAHVSSERGQLLIIHTARSVEDATTQGA